MHRPGRRTRSLLVILLAAAPLRAADLGPTPREPDGGGAYELREHAPHLTDAERREIDEAIERNVARLRSTGLLPPPEPTLVALDWPLRAANGLTDYGFHGISGFVDQDPAFPGHLLDYDCGARTYDLDSGYNHRGTDIFTWPFGWNLMDADQVEVVAGAPGTIVLRQDGHFDRSCGLNGNPWNAVYVAHADGSIAWYGHMKSGSVTPKTVGQTVAAGEYLGVVGSSGSSTGPHLHLELYAAGGGLVDPFAGPCNALNATSWWGDQPAYFDSAVNKLLTGLAPPVFPACPQNEQPNGSVFFESGSRIYFTTFYRDQRAGQLSQFRIYAPGGTVWSSWSHSIATPAHYAASYWWWWFDFAPGAPHGTWRFEVTFEGQTYERFFEIGAPPAAARIGELRAGKAPGGEIRLEWDPSCLATDTDYNVYEGPLEFLNQHYPKLCSTGGRTTIRFADPGFDAYWLVVPANGSREGSYGTNSEGTERPVALPSCAQQLVSGCP